jgi:hypothetical protein
MTKRQPIKHREPRHKLALDTARYHALTQANVAACTTYRRPGEGVNDQLFCRTYAETFAQIYHRVIYGD